MNWLPYPADVSKFQFSKKVATRNGEKECLSIHAYYSISRYGDKVDLKIKQVRALVFGFKDGLNIQKYVDIFYKAVIEKKLIVVKHETVLIPIPASTQIKTRNRFNAFCDSLSRKLGVSNGYGAISTTDHTAFHNGADRNILPHLSFDVQKIRGKRILLLDDVITSGRTFQAISDKLYSLGAKSVQGIFLAHTTSRPVHGQHMDYEGRDFYFDDKQGCYVDLEDLM